MAIGGGQYGVTQVPQSVTTAAFSDYNVIRVGPAESYAANLLRINDYVILADGFPGVAAAVRDLGHTILPLNMSEFRKMDGSLTCLSLRF